MFFFANPKNKRTKNQKQRNTHNYPNCKVIADLVLVRWFFLYTETPSHCQPSCSLQKDKDVHAHPCKRCATKWAVPATSALNRNDTESWNWWWGSCLSRKAPSELQDSTAISKRIRPEERGRDLDVRSHTIRTAKVNSWARVLLSNRGPRRFRLAGKRQRGFRAELGRVEKRGAESR